MQQQNNFSQKLFNATVLITGLGYLVDMFDFFLFNMVRVKSLTDLGLSGQNLTDAGLLIINCQMAGILTGAYLWGVIGDRYGRKVGLFFSIALYSIGTLGCAFVFNVPSYAVARFIAGFGVAGELGAGIALITEKLNVEKRGIGVMIFITLGFVGVLLAALATQYLPWRTTYMIGGIAGLMLLFTRISLKESVLFEKAKNTASFTSFLRLLIRQPSYFRIWLAGIFLLSPIVFIPQIVWTLSPEIARAMHITDDIKAPLVLAIGHGCVVVSDLLACALSEYWRSRRRTTCVFLLFGALMTGWYFLLPPQSVTAFYVMNGLLGLSYGVWVITVCWIAEHVPTNIRATIATTTPNFARGIAIPMNLAYAALKPAGTLNAVLMIGIVIFALAFFGWLGLKETYGKDLDYVEK